MTSGSAETAPEETDSGGFNMSKDKKKNMADMPLGLTSALAKDIDALAQFASLSETDKEKFIKGASQVSSKQEMEAYVRQLSDNAMI